MSLVLENHLRPLTDQVIASTLAHLTQPLKMGLCQRCPDTRSVQKVSRDEQTKYQWYSVFVSELLSVRF